MRYVRGVEQTASLFFYAGDALIFAFKLMFIWCKHVTVSSH